MHASCLMVKGQVIDKYLMHYDTTSVIVNFEHEPATIDKDSSLFHNLFPYIYSYFSYKNFIFEKNTGKEMARLFGNQYFDSANMYLALFRIPDTLITKKGDTLKIIPNSFYSNNKFFLNQQQPNYQNRFFILPDKTSDTVYHMIFFIDSLSLRRYYKSYSYLTYRVDFSISKYGAKLLTPYPMYLGFIPDVERGQKYNSSYVTFEYKYHQIRILNSLDKFYFYTFVKDTQIVYSCNLLNVKLEQTTHDKYYTDTNYITPNYGNHSTIYFNKEPSIVLDEYCYYDTLSHYNKAIKLLKVDNKDHILKNTRLVDSLILDINRDTSNRFFNYEFSDNGRYLYTLQINEILSKKRTSLLIKKYDLNDSIPYSLKYSILYNNFLTSPDTSQTNDYGYYCLTKGPCGRIFVVHNYDFIFTINKPDMPFGHDKIYSNFPAIVFPYTPIYNINFFTINDNTDWNMLHYNYKLNTTEEYHTNSVILHTDADAAYKTFKWYVWNQQTQQFDSSTGTSCYIPNIGSGIYYKLKGTTAYGYSAWFSDSLYARHTCPKAKFGIEQIKHCQYNTTYFYDSSTSTDYSPGIPHSWHWDFGDGKDTTIYAMAALDIQGKGNIEHIYTKSGLFKITLIYYNGVCNDTFTQFQPIYITPAPQPGFTVDPMKSCIPQVFHVILSHQDTIVSEKYYIYKNSNFLQDSVVNIPVSQKPIGFNLNQKDSGVYRIKQYLTGTTGCITSDSITLQFDNRPILKLINDTFICSDEVLQLSATLGSYKYQWSNGDTSQSIIINRGGNYSVNVINGSCIVSDSTNITQDLDEKCKLNISVYPNPFGNEFKVAIYSRTTQNINIQLYEMSGKQVASYNNIPVNQFATFSVNTADLASAMYVLYIYTNEKKFVYKVVKLGD